MKQFQCEYCKQIVLIDLEDLLAQLRIQTGYYIDEKDLISLKTRCPECGKKGIECADKKNIKGRFII